ncbi:MAG: hypothetical protein WKG07_20385 [Hymenobacter sp.]
MLPNRHPRHREPAAAHRGARHPHVRAEEADQHQQPHAPQPLA